MIFEKQVKLQKEYFLEGTTLSLEFRIEMLGKLKKAILQNENKIYNAFQQDLNKSKVETYETEIGLVLHEISEAQKNLKKWIQPKKVKDSILTAPAKGKIYYEPHGVVLIISPWNYPFQLALSPLVGAISAGNCVVLKPSELSPNVSEVVKEILESVFLPEYVFVALGDKEVSTELLKQPFDYIFFTGSENVGKVVMKAASENLTPVTLELGGKSPCIVDDSVSVKKAAKQIAWGKCLNAGQTCVAPDYLYVKSSVKEKLIQEIYRNIVRFYGKTPETNEQYPKIINQNRFIHLMQLLNDTKKRRIGGHPNFKTLQISPAIIDHVTWDDPIMQEEIFGPILPVMTYDDIDEVIGVLKRKPKSLALYIFTEDPKVEHKIIRNISFGGGCVNETIMHLTNPNLPFGGVGASGMGSYHGIHSFYTFSHAKSILHNSLAWDNPIRYAPYKKIQLALAKKVLK